MSNLGKGAKDIITDFEGIITGQCTYITGCDQVLVQPVCKDVNTFIEPRWFDINRVKIDKEHPAIVLETTTDKGADLQAPKK